MKDLHEQVLNIVTGTSETQREAMWYGDQAVKCFSLGENGKVIEY